VGTMVGKCDEDALAGAKVGFVGTEVGAGVGLT
jgi:hypothetical protein